MSPCLSGVPQGTVLGPLLFSLYINDITKGTDSELRLFADDCVWNSEIKNGENLGGYRPFRALGKEFGYGVPAGQMQYNADYKETYQEDQCFLYLRGNSPR